MEGRQGQSQFRETEEATQTTADLTAFVLPKKDCKELLVWMASAIENDYSVLSKTSALQQEQVRVCSLEIPKSSEMMFENINSWSFDIFTINDDDLPKLVEKVFINLSIFEYCLLDLKKVRTFINCIMAQYRSYVPYHNFRHACDVLHAVYLILTLTEAADKFSQLEKLALAIAAVCHDVDHPGLTNAFLIACNDPLALRYNDLAVLENHHASITMKTLLGYETMSLLDIFSVSEQRYLRKLIVTTILATDMGQHFDIINTLSARTAKPDPFLLSPSYQLTLCLKKVINSSDANQEGKPAPTSSDDAILLMKMVIKCADISNIIKPFFLSEKWAALLLLEWFQQGDLEKKIGLPVSRNMDRDDPTALKLMTLGCIDYLGFPMYEATAVLLPSFRKDVLPNLMANRELWSSYSTTMPLMQVADRILVPLYPRMNLEDHSRPSEMVVVERARPPVLDGQSLRAENQSLEKIRQATVENSQGFKISHGLLPSFSSQERPVSLLFGTPVQNYLPKLDSNVKGNASLRSTSLKLNRLPSSRLSMMSRHSLDSLPIAESSIRSESSIVSSYGDGTLDSKRNSLESIEDIGRTGFWENIRSNSYSMWLNRALDSNIWMSINIPATLVAIFAGDFIRAVLPKKVDLYEEPIYFACLFLFLLELIILSIVKKGYFVSFSFCLDLVGSLSLIPYALGTFKMTIIMARAWKAAKLITRMSKWMQTAKCLNVILVTRLFKLVHYKNSLLSAPDGEPFETDTEHHMPTKPSQVWTKLSELTSQKLVIGILILNIAFPYLKDQPEDLAPVLLLNTLDNSPLGTLRFNASLGKLLAFNMQHGYEIVYLGVSCHTAFQTITLDCNDLDKSYHQIIPPPVEGIDGKKEVGLKYREVELIKVVSDSLRSEAYFSILKRSRKNYGMNMALTILTLGTVAAWSFFLSWDSNQLLIQPIERMVQFIRELADDPVSFVAKAKPQRANLRHIGEVMETKLLEAALVKIASLSKVALGNAGMDILSANLRGAEFNPMIPGKKVTACFGFCDIRNFTDATECLQEDVMMFVNKIADVIHNKVVLHHGFPNKNIGDAFLIVWKKTISDTANKSKGRSFADCALKSFIDIIQTLETSQTIKDFSMHPSIQQRMPGYRIHMGFGLHVGWAIEGAIGSSHKVDPSYLSPHVNLASRLEAATKQYGVMLLISETVVANLTMSSLRKPCRKLDHVTVKGSVERLTLYTFDMPLFQQDLKVDLADYRNVFEAAVDSYIGGNWHKAVEIFQDCMQMWPSDRPPRVLLAFMATHKNMVPANWKGYRELTEK